MTPIPGLTSAELGHASDSGHVKTCGVCGGVATFSVSTVSGKWGIGGSQIWCFAPSRAEVPHVVGALQDMTASCFGIIGSRPVGRKSRQAPYLSYRKRPAVRAKPFRSFRPLTVLTFRSGPKVCRSHQKIVEDHKHADWSFAHLRSCGMANTSL